MTSTTGGNGCSGIGTLAIALVASLVAPACKRGAGAADSTPAAIPPVAVAAPDASAPVAPAETDAVAAPEPDAGPAAEAGTEAASGAPEVASLPDCPARPAAAPPKCGSLSDLPLMESPIDLLGGRLRLRALQGAADMARQQGIMAAPESVEEETRIFLESGDEKFVIMAYELFQLADEDFDRAARKMFAGELADADQAFCMEPVAPAAEGVKIRAIAPTALDTSNEGVLVLSLVAAHPDGTAQRLNLYVNPAAARDGAGCVALAGRIAATLAAGPRTLDRAGGTRTLTNVSAGHDVTLTVPPNNLVTLQEGPDFSVHRVRKIVALGELAPMLGVYVGGHPSQAGANAVGPTETVSAPLFGGPVDWISWAIPGAPGAPEWRHLETVQPIPETGGLFAHVFLEALSGEVDAVRGIAQTLAVVPRSE